MKISSEHILFTDKCHAALDGSDGRRKGWYVLMSSPDPASARMAGGVMFWAAIVGNELVKSFLDADGDKMTAQVYINLSTSSHGTKRKTKQSVKT